MGGYSSTKNYKSLLLGAGKNSTTTRQSKYGFTLVELLIAFGFFFTLGSLLVNAFHPLNTIKMSNDQKRKSDLMQVQSALETYYRKQGVYPGSSSNFEIMDGKNALQWGHDSWMPYITLLPNDPNYNRRYIYYVDNTNGYQSYWLYTSLEKGQEDQDACGKNCSLGNGSIPATACSKNGSDAVCNFGVSSTNVSP